MLQNDERNHASREGTKLKSDAEVQTNYSNESLPMQTLKKKKSLAHSTQSQQKIEAQTLITPVVF